MTEGIIHKVYRKIAVPLIIEIDDVDVPVIPQQMVYDAFKDLIAEIEKFYKTECNFNEGDSALFWKRKLIGDTE